MASSKGRKAIADGYEAAAAPVWILRHHAPSAIHHIRLIRNSPCSEIFLAAGDSEGRVSLTSLNDYRPRHFWKAHRESILGLDFLSIGDDCVLLSSGRDNVLNVFSLSAPHGFTSAVLPSRIQAELPVPENRLQLDINALNYCSFSAIQTDYKDAEAGITLAVPHTIDSGYIDLYHLPSKTRTKTAIGKADLATLGVKESRAAIVMSLQILDGDVEGFYRIIAGYEDGLVKSWEIKSDSVALQWSQRCHSESIMSIAVSKNNAFCVSVAADRLLIKYDLNSGTVLKTMKSNSSGHACVAIREDDELIATGGWDGCIRLYDAELEQVGSLRYHKDTVQALSFVQGRILAGLGHVDEDTDCSEGSTVLTGSKVGKEGLDNRILASGGKEGRICLWKT